MAVVRSLDAWRALERATALSTLIRQRHLTPSCGGLAPTAERTVGLARTVVESLHRDPELENSIDPKRSFATPIAVDTQRAGLSGLLPARHVFQIGNDEIDFVVAQIIGRKARHGREGQVRTVLGLRIRSCSPCGMKYSVGFCGTLRSGPTFATPAPFSLWQVRNCTTNRACPARTGSVDGSAESTASAGQRAAGEGWLTRFAIWYGHCSLRMLPTLAPVQTM